MGRESKRSRLDSKESCVADEVMRERSPHSPRKHACLPCPCFMWPRKLRIQPAMWYSLKKVFWNCRQYKVDAMVWKSLQATARQVTMSSQENSKPRKKLVTANPPPSTFFCRIYIYIFFSVFDKKRLFWFCYSPLYFLFWLLVTTGKLKLLCSWYLYYRKIRLARRRRGVKGN